MASDWLVAILSANQKRIVKIIVKQHGFEIEKF